MRAKVALSIAFALGMGAARASAQNAPPAANAPNAPAAPAATAAPNGELAPTNEPATPPTNGTAAETSTNEPAAPPASEPPPPSMLEVTVEGDKAPPGSATMRRRDIREMPGVLGDPYRAIEVQPGVTPTATGVPYFFIRGAPPGNIGYFFDGVQVPLLFHVGAGPSVIPAALVQRVDMHLGPLPANVGRFAGAVVEADSMAPSPTWRGEGGLRSGDVGGVIEGPVSKNVTALVGGRYAAGAALLSALVPSVDLAYADYQARVSWQITPESRLSALAFGSYDYLAAVTGGEVAEGDVLLDADFHRLDLRYDREWPDGGKMRAGVTLGLDQSRGVGVIRARDWKVNARATISRPVADGHVLLRGGIEASVDGYQVTPRADTCPAGGCTTDSGDSGDSSDSGESDPRSELNEAFRELFPSRIDVAVGAWADALIALNDRSTITPGIRVDHYTSLGNTALAVDPRLVGKFALNDHIRLIPAVGLASQLPGFAPLPALQIAGIEGGLQRSLQTSFGVEVSVLPIEFVATVFRQATFNLTDPIGTGRGTDLGPGRFLTRSQGDSYGLEMGARGALRRDLFFLVSYTLSRSTRTSDGLTVPSAFDRTHVAHVALLYDLGRGWRAGVRHVFYSGFPADEATEGHPPSEHPDRVKPFYRFDVRLSKRWKLSERAYIGLVFDIQNATLSKEVFDVTCDGESCKPRTLGPITIPGLALEGGF